MRKTLLALILLGALLVPARPLRAMETVLYDGETPATDLNRANGGPYYETWWGGADANSLTDSADSPHLGKACMKWTCSAAWSGGAFMADPSWVGQNIETLQSVENLGAGRKRGREGRVGILRPQPGQTQGS